MWYYPISDDVLVVVVTLPVMFATKIIRLGPGL
jgi:hypothetical protein